MNFELMANSFPLLLAGAAITVEITAMSVTFGLLIGCMIVLRACAALSRCVILLMFMSILSAAPRCWYKSSSCILRCLILSVAVLIRLWQQFPPAPSTAVRMLPKSSVQAFSLSTRARWKQAAASV